MARGFSVIDALNQKQDSKTVAEESPRARFRTKDIPISKMYRNEMNFYKVGDIEELAGDILMHGLKQNLELVYEPCELGEYRIVSGERRWKALKHLVKEGYQEFEVATCKLTTPRDADEEQIEVISANAYRTKRIADVLEEERRLKESLERMKAAGKKIKGYDLDSGRLRDVIASMLCISGTKTAQIESVNHNLIPEFKEEVNRERITFSAAYELSGMEQEEQRRLYAVYQETGGITHKEVKTMKSEMAAGQQDVGEQKAVSESDTGQSVPYEPEPSDVSCKPDQSDVPYEPEPSGGIYEGTAAAGDMEPEEETGTEETKPGTEKRECRPGDDYEDAHPESIISLCYSCQRYRDCNVKTGTCKKCDRYINKAEAEKTEAQRYSEEQDQIDRGTKRKLREKAEKEKMENLPSDHKKEERGSRIHHMRMGVRQFDEVCCGRKTFELCRNDEDYRAGDILELAEYSNGVCTRRAVAALVVCILEESAGLEEGYCILGIRPDQDGFYWMEEEKKEGEQR